MGREEKNRISSFFLRQDTNLAGTTRFMKNYKSNPVSRGEQTDIFLKIHIQCNAQGQGTNTRKNDFILLLFISIAGHCDLKYIIKCIVIYYNSLYL